MAIPPDGWVNAYLNVFVPTLRMAENRMQGGPSAFVPITQYANANHVQQQAERSSAGGQFQNWIRSPGHQVGRLFNGHLVTVPGAAPPLSITMGKIYLAFHGKASPDECRSVLRLVSLWMSTQTTVTGDIANNLRTFANGFLGVDCNGFVGTYLRDNYPQSQFGPEFQIQSVPHHSVARASIRDVRQLDLVVTRGWGHVSIIGTILGRTETEIQCVLCESRSEALGGVHAGRVTIRRNPGPRGVFHVGQGDATGIYGLRSLQGC